MVGFLGKNIPTYKVWSGEGPEDGNIVWDDVLINSGLFRFAGSNDPVWRDWTVDGKTFRILTFDKNDEIYFSVQIPHKYKEGTNLRPHVHWTPHDRGVAESGNTVGWKLDYIWSNVNGVFSSSGTYDMSGACTGTDDYHEVSNSGSPYVDGTGKKISSMLFCRLYRSDTGADDTWVGIGNNSPGLLQFDFHIQISSPGSRQEWIKND